MTACCSWMVLWWWRLKSHEANTLLVKGELSCSSTVPARESPLELQRVGGVDGTRVYIGGLWHREDITQVVLDSGSHVCRTKAMQYLTVLLRINVNHEHNHNLESSGWGHQWGKAESCSNKKLNLTMTACRHGQELGGMWRYRGSHREPLALLSPFTCVVLPFTWACRHFRGRQWPNSMKPWST